MSNLFELYKKAHSLDNSKKNYLVNNFDNIISIIDSEEMIKEASGIHDPETLSDIKALIEKIERFMKNDGDISYGNISVFLHPLSSCSRRMVFRPVKLVGLTRKLNRLSKDFEQSVKNQETSGIQKTRRNFNNIIIEIKKRVNKDEKFSLDKKAGIEHTASVVDVVEVIDNFKHLLMNNIGFTIQDVIEYLENNAKLTSEEKHQIIQEIEQVQPSV